jgi:mRNA interferase MazF
MFYGIPLSTKIKDGNFFYNFTFLDKPSNALLVQGRLFDTKRLENRMGMIEKTDFENIKKSVKELLSV